MSASARHRKSGAARRVLSPPLPPRPVCARCARVRPLREVRVWDATFAVCIDCEYDLGAAMRALGANRQEDTR
jgi:hypothetical protein